MTKHKFYVEAKLQRNDADQRWVRMDYFMGVESSVDYMRQVRHSVDGAGYLLFSKVRIRHRGFTLETSSCWLRVKQ